MLVRASDQGRRNSSHSPKQARRRSHVEGMEEADQGGRGSSYSPKGVEGNRRRRSRDASQRGEQAEGGDNSLRGNSLRGMRQGWEQAEGGDNSLRRARGSRQEGGAGEAQGPVLTQGRSLSRSSRTMQAAQADGSLGDSSLRGNGNSLRRDRQEGGAGGEGGDAATTPTRRLRRNSNMQGAMEGEGRLRRNSNMQAAQEGGAGSSVSPSR
jgi:hypothetical protein